MPQKVDYFFVKLSSEHKNKGSQNFKNSANPLFIYGADEVT